MHYSCITHAWMQASATKAQALEFDLAYKVADEGLYTAYIHELREVLKDTLVSGRAAGA